MRDLYDAVGDEEVSKKALAWIDLETDPKNRKKYAGVWEEKKK